MAAARTPPPLDIDAVVACTELEPVLDRLKCLGFVVTMMMPADDPAVAVLAGGGLTVRLVRGKVEAGALAASPPLPTPEPSFEVTRVADTGWGTGRAGMEYRDLLPSRQGGRFIASHIRIPDAGPVPDDVHFHRVRFQMIFCIAGWVRLVYEDQGRPFILEAGDCVLQPPEIRHRVLESSAGLEVVEVTSPAVHETWFDHDQTLPTAQRDRSYDGQRFLRHRAAAAAWTAWRAPGFECSDTGIGTATGGLAGARTVRGSAGQRVPPVTHDGELLWWFMREGSARIEAGGRDVGELRRGDAVAVPGGMAHAVAVGGDGLLLLELTVPDRPVFTAAQESVARFDA